jgi:hypothetical protein
MIRVVHPGSQILMLTFSHPGSRIQGSKRYPIPNPGSGSATLTVKNLLPWLRPPGAAILCRISYLGSGLQEQQYCEESPTLAEASRRSNTVKNLLPWLRPPRAAVLCRISYLGSGLQEQHYCDESPTLAEAPKSSITVKNLLPWLRPPGAAIL